MEALAQQRAAVHVVDGEQDALQVEAFAQGYPADLVQQCISDLGCDFHGSMGTWVPYKRQWSERHKALLYRRIIPPSELECAGFHVDPRQ